MKLKSFLVEPPGGWIYTQPETGWTGKEVTFGMLVQKAAQHRANMKLPTKGDLASEIEAAICARLTPENQIAHCEQGQAYPKSVHWTLVERFLTTAAAYVLGPDSLVPQAEAESRASTCATCPLNVGLSGCAPCRSALTAIREKLLARHTEQDSLLGACGWCSCDNKLQVHVPLSALKAAKHDLPPPPAWCWQHPDAQNHQRKG